MLEQVHFVIETLLSRPDGWRAVVREMVAQWPLAAPGELVLTLVTAASHIEETFAPGSPSREAADRAWRLAALLGADLYAMQVMQLPLRHAEDLRQYWAVDPYFRDL